MTQSPIASKPVTVPPAGRYLIDADHSTVTLTTRHFFGLGAVRGTLRLRGGRIQVADPVTASTAGAQVAASTFRSGNDTRDAAVLSSRLLSAEAYPSFTFTSTAVVRGEERWLVRGELEVRGVSRPVEVRIDEISPGTGTAFRASARLTVDRYDFGITAYRGFAARRLTVHLDILARSADARSADSSDTQERS